MVTGDRPPPNFWVLYPRPQQSCHLPLLMFNHLGIYQSLITRSSYLAQAKFGTR